MAPFESIGSIFGLVCAINVLNYVDRGLIPGAPIQLQAFVQSVLDVPPENVSVYIGLLVSAFIAAYSIFICVFGYLSIRHRPFHLVSIGLFLWVLASALSGISKTVASYPLLLTGRFVSGIGESAFQAIMPPFIDQHAPSEKRTFWLGLFGAAISVGTAIGYSYGSLMAQTAGWDIGFFVAGVVMLPLALVCARFIPMRFDHPMAYDPAVATADALRRCIDSHSSTADRRASVTLLGELASVLRSPLFWTSTLGYAAYTFTLAGLASFGPVILIGTGVLSDKVAATVFGALVVVAGMVGAPLGGYLVDAACRGRGTETDFRLVVATRLMFGLVLGGIALAFGAWLAVDSAPAFLVCMFFSLMLLFMTQSPHQVSILLSVEKPQRGFATGLGLCLMHLLGDVPSPIVLGWLKDRWAPDCGSVLDHDHIERLNPDCVLHGKTGLTRVLLFAFLWLGWAALFWGISYAIAHKKLRRQPKSVVLFDNYNTPVLSRNDSY
ncbi:Aste57867_16699 [Aphanomyces stellatus]|uniref:Aste57867_16699 protein n=1 Tax=Aphanomyces stellatus TaxID=120398 RepID=A0A485L621_9STRA|nr:hypothetical protein As57867_016642 [Aphanomyces stellatus]VFT93469.1 Aste57867_16699 [Aphanomyces stellatus]